MLIGAALSQQQVMACEAHFHTTGRVHESNMHPLPSETPGTDYMPNGGTLSAIVHIHPNKTCGSCVDSSGGAEHDYATGADACTTGLANLHMPLCFEELDEGGTNTCACPLASHELQAPAESTCQEGPGDV